MTFYDVRLDPKVVYGAEGGPTYVTVVVTAPYSHVEQRIVLTSRAFRKYKIDLSEKSLSEMQALEAFFVGMRGKGHGFRFHDKKDYKATSELITCVNDGGVFTAQLQKTYGTYGQSETRPIKKVNTDMTGAPAVTLTRDGVAFPSSGNWTLNNNTGLVTFTADQTTHVIRWTGWFDVPVRLDTDEMMDKWEDFDVLSWTSIVLMEINI